MRKVFFSLLIYGLSSQGYAATELTEQSASCPAHRCIPTQAGCHLEKIRSCNADDATTYFLQNVQQIAQDEGQSLQNPHTLTSFKNLVQKLLQSNDRVNLNRLRCTKDSVYRDDENLLNNNYCAYLWAYETDFSMKKNFIPYMSLESIKHFSHLALFDNPRYFTTSDLKDQWYTPYQNWNNFRTKRILGAIIKEGVEISIKQKNRGFLEMWKEAYPDQVQKLLQSDPSLKDAILQTPQTKRKKTQWKHDASYGSSHTSLAKPPYTPVIYQDLFGAQ